MTDKPGRLRRFGQRVRKGASYVSNGSDFAVAGKIGAAAGAAYIAKDFLKKGAAGIKTYSPGRVIRKAVTRTEKGVYNLDQTLEREIKKIPGGKEALSFNEWVVGGMWRFVGVEPGSPEKERTQKFYERIKAPMPYAVEKKTFTETRIPPTYNTDAANQKGLLNTACTAVDALLGIYVVKEGAKHFYNKWRGKK